MGTGEFGLITAMWILVGVYAYSGFTHLQHGLRRPRKRLHILFGVLACFAAYAALTAAWMAKAQTPASYQSAAWQSTLSVSSVFILLPWFLRDYLAARTRWPAYCLSAAYTIVLIGNLALPHSMLLTTAPELGVAAMPWGEQVTRALTPPHAWLRMFWLAHAGTIAYLIYCVIYAVRFRVPANAWGLAIAVLPFAASLLLNILIGVGIVRSYVFVGSVGFMLMIFVMSVVLSEELRRTTKQMQTVLDNVPAAVYLKHADGRYLFANRRFEQLCGRHAAEIVGKEDAEIFPSDIADARSKADREVLESGRQTEVEQALAGNGSAGPVTYSWLRFALANTRGERHAVCGIATDVSERKAATDALRDLSINLERRVARRTTELLSLNRELEAFAYSVSHDLRAPLTAVNGFAELLLREHGPKLDQTAQRYLTRIRDGSMRMAALIQDLLGLSRVTQQTLERRNTDLVPMIEAAIKNLREQDSRPIAVTVPTTLPVNGDAKLLGLALNNLLANAWKYTGKVFDARVEVGSVTQNGETVYFVRDNGAGFNQEYAGRLFRPFVRLHTDNEFPGSGIGLATVARIVSRHGGRIWAEGRVNEGATIYFTLPPPDDDADIKAA